MYKSQELPTVEFPTPAVYHCEATTLDELDRVQRRFLRAVNLTAEQALEQYKLAPLQARRDMAMLGLVHRTVLGTGPEHFRKWFFAAGGPSHNFETKYRTAKHSKQLHDYLDGSHTELLRRSALGLTRVYNRLPQATVDARSVRAFQRELQTRLTALAKLQAPNWEATFSCRKERLRTCK